MARNYKTVKAIISEKRRLLHDFGYSSTEEIENKIVSEITANPKKNPQAVADAVCRPYVIKAISGNSWSQVGGN